jgi:hypothetical protein
VAVDTSLWVRSPPDLGIDHHVDLAHEVLVRLLRLLPSPSVLHTNKKVNSVKIRQ